jgi:hypothetical protein
MSVNLLELIPDPCALFSEHNVLARLQLHQAYGTSDCHPRAHQWTNING